VYVRPAGKPAIETVLQSHPLHDFRSAENRTQLASVLKGPTGGAVR
jgi:hypothetical protein